MTENLHLSLYLAAFSSDQLMQSTASFNVIFLAQESPLKNTAPYLINRVKGLYIREINKKSSSYSEKLIEPVVLGDYFDFEMNEVRVDLSYLNCFENVAEL